MTLSNVRLIFAREVRDQLRDRRTLFMIAVLPIFLYPLLGMSLLQVAQFMEEHPTRVLVVGAQGLPASPALFDGQRFAVEWFLDPGRSRLLELCFAPPAPAGRSAEDARANAVMLVGKGSYDAALYFPPDFAERLEAFREATTQVADDHRAAKAVKGKPRPPRTVPSPEIICDTASDKSRLASAHLSEVLWRWTQRIGDENLRASGVSAAAAKPVAIGTTDVASAQRRNGAIWSKLLPVLLLVWALTGAFYPAVDLCAGEKERGTLETLLSSPAARSEIVLGKLLTIMLFSAATALLNLASVAVTGCFVLSRFSDLGPPPLAALAALGVALGPMAALFSALCLALAAMARSTKEGQYYLMPLLLVTMPLVVLPMAPGVELTFGNSLIPITGVVLVLRSVLEGDYGLALRHVPAVATVTLAACFLAIRWAVDQFNRESVLFRESERLDLRLWLRHLFRDRRPTPTAAAATCCGVLIVTAHFFLSLSGRVPEGFGDFFRSIVTTQLGVIALPAVLMTLLLTSSPRRTLLLRRPRWLAIPAAALLAVALHPMATILQSLVCQLYPVSESVRPALERITLLLRQADIWPLMAAMALVPAVCEELAFRGFILSGFRHLGHRWRAIVYSALFFGVTHGVLQQSLIATIIGLVLGYLAMQSGSIVPGMIFHACHNALLVANSRVTAAMLPDGAWVRGVLTPADGGGCLFEWPVALAGGLVAAIILTWFGRRRRCAVAERELPCAVEVAKAAAGG